jgi:hypothetical protein
MGQEQVAMFRAIRSSFLPPSRAWLLGAAILALVPSGCRGGQLVVPQQRLFWEGDLAARVEAITGGAPRAELERLQYGRKVRTRFVWEAPGARLLPPDPGSSIGLDAPPPRASRPSYDLEDRTVALARTLLPDRGEADAAAADILVRVVAADYVDDPYELKPGTAVLEPGVSVKLEAEGRTLGGAPFHHAVRSRNCRLAGERWQLDFCLDEAITEALVGLFTHHLGASVRVPAAHAP